MNLDEQFRAVLNQEAEMQTPTRPDVEELIIGGQTRLRHRRNTRLGIAAAAVVLVVGGAYGVTHVDRGSTRSEPGIATQPAQPSDPTTNPTPYPGLSADLPGPGTYRKIVGFDTHSGAPIEVDLTFEDAGWYAGSQPVITADDESNAAGLGVFEARAVPSTSGCSASEAGKPGFREAATTPDALGRQLAELPKSTVVQPLTPTVAFGHDAVHLRLRIDAGCPSPEAYLVAVADTGSLGITYTAPWSVVVDFLVVDVDGTPIVVALWHDADASRARMDEATQVRDSLSFVSRE